MRSTKDKIRTSFSKAVPHYDAMAEIQNIIIDKMLETIRDQSFNNILELGAGTGSLSKQLVTLNPHARLILVDFSRPMLDQAQDKLQGVLNRVTMKEMDIENITHQTFLEESFDMVISSSTFQWLTNLDELFTALYSFLRDKGVFLFSYYGPSTYQELDSVLKLYKKTGDLTIPARHFPALSFIEKKIRNLFGNVRIREYRLQKEYDDLYSLLKKIKNSGEYGYGLNKKIIFTKSDIANLEKIYLEKYYKILATFQFYIIYTKKL